MLFQEPQPCLAVLTAMFFVSALWMRYELGDPWKLF